MAKDVDPAAAEETQAPAQQQPQQMMQVEVDDTHVTASYANFCRVTGSPEELIIDFGLNPQQGGGGSPAGATETSRMRLRCALSIAP